MTIKNFEPIGGRILIEINKEETTSSGIVLQTSKEPETGKVVAVFKDLNDKISVGDSVYYGRMPISTAIKFEEGEFFLLELRDIKAIIRGDTNEND